MPFDQVVVRMSLKTLYAGGLKLWFDYYRKNKQEQLEKLATGIHKCLWVKHDHNGKIEPAAMPRAVCMENHPMPYHGGTKDSAMAEMRIYRKIHRVGFTAVDALTLSGAA